MPAPTYLWNETGAFDAVKAFLVRVCPEVKEENIYRSHPAAVPAANPGPTIVLIPLQGGPPTRISYMGESDLSKQRQLVQVQITKAAVGEWIVNVLGEDASYVAGGGDTLTTIRDGLRDAVDLLALPVTTSVTVVKNAPTLVIQGDVAGVPLFVTLTPPAGGTGAVLVIDDTLRRVQYNWGLWTLRMVFRDQPPSQQGNPSPNRIASSQLADRVMSVLEASNEWPITPGLAAPTEGTKFQEVPPRISWRETRGPFTVPEQSNGTWTRGVAIDVVFDASVGVAFDVPGMTVEVGEINIQDPT